MKELKRLQRNYRVSECEDGKEGISRDDFNKNITGKDVSKTKLKDFCVIM